MMHKTLLFIETLVIAGTLAKSLTTPVLAVNLQNRRADVIQLVESRILDRKDDFSITPVPTVNGTQISPTAGIIRNFVKENKGIGQNFKDDIKDKIATRVGEIRKLFQVTFLRQAKVTAKGSNYLTVLSNGNSITVNITDKTRLRRRFFGKSTIDEIQVNDLVNVTGRWTDDNHAAVDAVLIRDLSIMKRFGIFIGTVTAINGSDWTLKTVHRGNLTVTVLGSAKYSNRKNETISQGDIQIGHRVRVRGLWDQTNSTTTQVSAVKDFSLPPKSVVTPTPTAMPSPTMTPTPTPV